MDGRYLLLSFLFCIAFFFQGQTQQLVQAVLKEAIKNERKEYEMNDAVTMAGEK